MTVFWLRENDVTSKDVMGYILKNWLIIELVEL